MLRETFIRQIYADINYGKDYAKENPDVGFIQTAISPIPTGSLKEFYQFLYDDNAYINEKTGAVLKNKLGKASRNFMDILKSRLWKKYDLESKVDNFIVKARSLSKYDSGEKNLIDFIGSAKLERIKFSCPTTGDKMSFTEDDLEIIRTNSKEVIFIDINTLSSLEYKEKIVGMYKTLYTKKYLIGDKKGSGSARIEGSEQKRVVSLLGNTVKRI